MLARLEADPVDLDRIAIVSRVASPYRLLLHEHLDAGRTAPPRRPALVGGPEHARAGPARPARPARARLPPGGRRPMAPLRPDPVARADRCRPPVGTPSPGGPASSRASTSGGTGSTGGARSWPPHSRRGGATPSTSSPGPARSTSSRPSSPSWAGSSAPGAGPGPSGPPGRSRSSTASSSTRTAASTGPDEAAADDWRDVRARVGALADLDAVDGPADAGRFRRVLADELSRRARRVGRLGQGVQVGDLESVYGLDLDLVVVVGMAEGWYPPRHREDPLLPDHELSEAGLADALGGPDRSDERRDHLAARAAGAEVVLLAPRSDPRGQRELQPARWLLEEMRRRSGRTVGVGDVAGLDAAWLDRPRSFEEAVRTVSVPLDAGERDLAALLAIDPGRVPGPARPPRRGGRHPPGPGPARRWPTGGTGCTASGPAGSVAGTSCASTTRPWRRPPAWSASPSARSSTCWATSCGSGPTRTPSTRRASRPGTGARWSTRSWSSSSPMPSAGTPSRPGPTRTSPDCTGSWTRWARPTGPGA